MRVRTFVKVIGDLRREGCLLNVTTGTLVQIHIFAYLDNCFSIFRTCTFNFILIFLFVTTKFQNAKMQGIHAIFKKI